LGWGPGQDLGAVPSWPQHRTPTDLIVNTFNIYRLKCQLVDLSAFLLTAAEVDHRAVQISCQPSGPYNLIQLQ